MKTPVFLALGLMLCGCAAQTQTPVAVAAAPFEDSNAEPRVVCKKEKPTGSNRPVTVCREVADALDQEQTKRDIRVLQRQSELAREVKKQ